MDADGAHAEVGHLDGWGRGLFDGSNALYFMRSRGTTGAHTARWIVRGAGVLQISARSCRIGVVGRTVELG